MIEGNTPTNIFKASYVSDDPLKTQRVLEVLQDLYQAYNLQQQEYRLNRGLATIEQQLNQANQNLSLSQSFLGGFLSKNNLVDPQQQANQALDTLVNVKAEQQSLKTEYQASLARQSALQARLDISPESALVAARVSQSSRYQALLDQLQAKEIALAQRRIIYTDDDPATQLLREERQALLEQLNQASTTIIGISSPVAANGSGAIRQMSETDISLITDWVTTEVDLSSLQARMNSLAALEQNLQADLNRFPALIAQYDRLQPQVESNRQALQELLTLKQQYTAEIARGGFSWQLVESPQLGYRVQGKTPSRNLLLGTVVGLFLGGIAAFAREFTDPVIHSLDDLKKHSNLRILGVLPTVSRNKAETAFSQLLNTINPQGEFPISFSQETKTIVQAAEFRDSVDLTFKNIELLIEHDQRKVFLVTSAQEAEGKTTVAIGLALSAARLHQKVLLIDVNMRQPRIHSYFRLDGQPGLTALLVDEQMDLHYTVQRISLDGCQLDVIPAGDSTLDPIRLLSLPQVKEVLQACGADYDWVILDGSSVLGIVDTLQIAGVVDAVILVGSLDLVTQADIQATLTTLQPFNVLGIVANQDSSKTSSLRPMGFYPDEAINSRKAVVEKSGYENL